MLLLWGKARFLGEEARGVVKADDGAGVEGLEAAALGGGEIIWQHKGGELVQGAANVLEAALELDGSG